MHQVSHERRVQGREIALVGLFAALTAVGAIFSIPLGGAVPFTLQLMFTLLAGALLGSRLGALSQLSYLLMGFVGLPVFSMRRAGIGMLFGPTGGFLVGFVLGAYVTGLLVEWAVRRRGRSGPFLTLIAMLAGALTTYVPGIAWLAWHVGGLQPAAISMLPFIPIDLIKAGLGTGIYVMLATRGLLLQPAPAGRD